MYPQDRIRFHLLAARKLSDAGRRDETIAGLLAEALTEASRTGDATEQMMRRRYGFTQDELDTHRTAAVDAATLHAVRFGPCEAGLGG